MAITRPETILIKKAYILKKVCNNAMVQVFLCTCESMLSFVLFVRYLPKRSLFYVYGLYIDLGTSLVTSQYRY
jgi:hypothetical protein